jgi:hypothetical protein
MNRLKFKTAGKWKFQSHERILLPLVGSVELVSSMSKVLSFSCENENLVKSCCRKGESYGLMAGYAGSE